MTVDVVIPQYGREDLTTKCVGTLRPTTTRNPVNVILVDNGSDPYDEGRCRHLSDLHIRIAQNIGYGRATNVGAAAGLGEFLFLLNNDTELHPGWLEPLLAAMDDPRCGAAAGRLIDPDGTLQHAGVRLFFDDNGILTAANITEEQDACDDVDCLAATALLVRREAWLSVGGYDVNYYNGYEDVDLALRLRVRGWRLAYCPESTVMHVKHASGPSRWAHVQENIALLHNTWAPRMQTV